MINKVKEIFMATGKGLMQKWFNVIVALFMVVIVIVIARGTVLTGKFGGNEFEVNATPVRVAALEARVDELESNLAFRAVWDVNKLLADDVYYWRELNKLRELLGGDERGVIVTGWLLDPDLTEGARYPLGTTTEDMLPNIIQKASTRWTDGPWRLEAVMINTYTGIVNGIALPTKGMNNLTTRVHYQVIDGTEILSTEEGRARMNWDPELGPMCVYVPARIGTQPIFILSIDFTKTATPEDVNRNMRAVLIHAPDIVEEITNHMRNINPGVNKLDWLFDKKGKKK